MVLKYPCILLFWTLFFSLADTLPPNAKEIVCSFKGDLYASFDSNCTGNATISLQLPSEFWKLLREKTAIFEVWTTNRDQEWNINCFQTALNKCVTDLQVHHPVTNRYLDLMVLLSPGGSPCSYLSLQSREGCFITQPVITSPAAIVDVGDSYSNEQLLYLILFFLSIFVVGCTVTVWIVLSRLRHRRRKALESLADLKVVLLVLSGDDLYSENESYPLPKTESSTLEMFKEQLENRCQLTVVNSDNAGLSYRNTSDVQSLLRSNHAFIIVPDARMVPVDEELLAPDEQVAVRMLNLLDERGTNCVFVRFSNSNSMHLILRQKYGHLSRVPVFTFSNLKDKKYRATDTVTKLLHHLKEHSTDIMIS